MRMIYLVLILVLSFSALLMRTVEATDEAVPNVDAPQVEFFEKNIRPILTEHCYNCHSARAIKLRGGLKLDSRRGVANGGEGGAVVVAGQPDKSRLIEAIRWTNPAFQMPPKKKLSPEQIESLELWVKMGAPDPRDDNPATATNSDKMPTGNGAVAQRLWAIEPVERPVVPAWLTESTNPIDAFIAAQYKAKGLTPAGRADKSILLRRVYLDLIGLPPTPAEQTAFLSDTSHNAYEKVVDVLLASEQHGVRIARRWLDVLRYADVDERMIAAEGIYLWRDWVINALNDDVPYDQFVRAQLTGYRSTERTQMSATGYRSKAEPRPDDMFALGLLARGAVIRDNKGNGELAINAVETISTAFMGLTVGCAKCHNHLYDPITQRDYYAMKALFDPLVPRKITLATAADLFASGRAAQEAADRKAPIEASISALTAPYQKRLYDDRVLMLPEDVRAIILKPERERSSADQKVADDYFPILRIDSGKITEVMSDSDRQRYQELQRQLSQVAAPGGSRSGPIPAFWTVEVDPKKAIEKSYVLTSGDPERPELNHEVEPGWPFAPTKLDFRESPLEAFSDWLTTPHNPLFARVAVNRMWQWHFGEGLQKTTSDFGTLGGVPVNRELLDWLASEFVERKFSMKAMHRLIVTSDVYKLTSSADGPLVAMNTEFDPDNSCMWHFPLQRLDAETIWDSIFAVAGDLDLSVGGPSFSAGVAARRPESASRQNGSQSTCRRAAYMIRGYSTSRDVMPNFLQAFDVDDGRAPCPQRTQSVTATQGLFMMNSDEMERASRLFADRLDKESNGNLEAAVDLGYTMTLNRLPSETERRRALTYLGEDRSNLKGLAWLLFNLDEFIYVR